MHNGTISFNGVDFSLLGKPTLRMQRVSDPPAPAFATRKIITLTVRVALEALDAGTIVGRLNRIKSAVGYGEGILRFETGGGHVEEWMALPASDNLESVLEGTSNSVEMVFTSIENYDSESIELLPKASYVPFGSVTPVILHSVREITRNVRTERHSDRMSARKVTMTTIVITSRVMMANPADSAEVRLAALRAKEIELEEQVKSKQGTLTVGEVAKVVKIQEFTPIIDDGFQTLDVRIQATSYALPDASTAEVAILTKERIDEGSGELVVSVSGTIEAESRAIALAKLDGIRNTQSSIIGSRITSMEVSDTDVEGFDTGAVAGDGWTGALSFTIERRNSLEGSHYNLKVNTNRDIRTGMRWTYSGTVKAVDAATALAKARSLGANAGVGMKVRDDETVETATEALNIEEPAEKFIQVTFTYEYEGPSDGFVTLELTSAVSTPRYGEWGTSLSGFVVASSKAVAEARLATALEGQGTALERSSRWTTTTLTPSGGSASELFQKLEFTFTRRDVRTYASAKYTDVVNTDYGTMMQTRSIQGTLWTNTEANSITALQNLYNTIFGEETPPTKTISTTPRELSAGGTNVISVGNEPSWWQVDFSAERTYSVEGEEGPDIIEASYTLSRMASINNSIVIPVPFARPVAQTETGWLPGKINIEAKCKARIRETAIEWVQTKRAIVNSIGILGTSRFETRQPTETQTPQFPPFPLDDSEPVLWEITGSYQWEFTGNVLDGLLT
jgi:hypothetical protein